MECSISSIRGIKLEPVVVKGFPESQPNYPKLIFVSIIFGIIYFILGYNNLFFFGMTAAIFAESTDSILFLILLGLMSLIEIAFFFYMGTEMDIEFGFQDLKMMTSFDLFMLVPFLILFGLMLFMAELVVLLALMMLALVIMMLGLFIGLMGLIAYGLAWVTSLLIEYTTAYEMSDIQSGILSFVYFILLWSYSYRENIRNFFVRNEKQTYHPDLVLKKTITDLKVSNPYLIAAIGKEIWIFERSDGYLDHNQQYLLLCKFVGHRNKIEEIEVIDQEIITYSSSKPRMGLWQFGNNWSFKTSMLDLLKIETEEDSATSDIYTYNREFEKALNRGMTKHQADLYVLDQMKKSKSSLNRWSQNEVIKPDHMAFNQRWIILCDYQGLKVFDFKTFAFENKYTLAKSLYHYEIILLQDIIVDVVRKHNVGQYLYLWDITHGITEPNQIVEIELDLDKFQLFGSYLLGYGNSKIVIYNLSGDISSIYQLTVSNLSGVTIGGDFLCVAVEKEEVPVVSEIRIYDLKNFKQPIKNFELDVSVKFIRTGLEKLYMITEKEVYSYSLVELS